jgi:hypothetical protein
MTDVDDWSDPTRGDPDPSDYDPSDYEEARAREEHEEHCDRVHGGKDCDCPHPEFGAGIEYSEESPF